MWGFEPPQKSLRSVGLWRQFTPQMSGAYQDQNPADSWDYRVERPEFGRGEALKERPTGR